ncbi:hypothetical protein HPB51_026660 [Rhipicephalus microplus]|uniref:Uncharacterized protein n=1 Tax=Rhipicephalus microplus TaxID=6941 RepID=A0A9J6D2F1_RHIMP|nr:hypothetical protein HPB51_026660 [Rhipicephalus microplus]
MAPRAGTARSTRAPRERSLLRGLAPEVHTAGASAARTFHLGTTQVHQAGVPAAGINNVGTATGPQNAKAERGHVAAAGGAGGRALLLERRTVEDAAACLARLALGPCPVAIPGLHAGGQREGSRRRPTTTDAAVEFCATCRVTVHFQCHYKGAMHVARTKAAAEGMATERNTSNPAPLSQRSDTNLAALCRQRMGEDPHFAALLSGLPPPAISDGPPMDGVATIDVDRLLEL